MKDIEDEVAKLRQRYVSAVAARNVGALLHLYDPKVRIFDAWGIWEYQGTEAWQVAIEGWFSSTPASDALQVRFSDCRVLGDANLATMTAIVGYAAMAPDGTESHAMQNRISWVLRTVGHQLRIVHEHTSAPIGFDDMKAILNRQP